MKKKIELFRNWLRKHKTEGMDAIVPYLRKRGLYALEDTVYEIYNRYMGDVEGANNEIEEILTHCLKYGMAPEEEMMFGSIEEVYDCYSEDGMTPQQIDEWVKSDARWCPVAGQGYVLLSGGRL